MVCLRAAMDSMRSQAFGALLINISTHLSCMLSGRPMASMTSSGSVGRPPAASLQWRAACTLRATAGLGGASGRLWSEAE